MRKAYQRFVEVLAERPGRSDLEAAFAAAANALGLPHFAYLLLKAKASPPDLITNYPDGWTRHYLLNRYDRIDPVIRLAFRSGDPFEWSAHLRSGKKGCNCAAFFDEAAQFGIRYGFTVPIKDRTGRVAAVTFATDEQQGAFQRSIDNYQSGLHLMALFFHRYACAALEPSRVIAGASLSARQLECLEWAARGKSAWETSRIIGISRRTVAFHLEAAKARLGVRTISHAIGKLIAERQRN